MWRRWRLAVRGRYRSIEHGRRLLVLLLWRNRARRKRYQRTGRSHVVSWRGTGQFRVLHHERDEKEAVRDRSFEFVLLQQLKKLWQFRAGFEGDEVDVFDGRIAVLNTDAITIAILEVVKQSREVLSVNRIFRLTDRDDHHVRAGAVLETTEIFVSFCWVNPALDWDFARNQL